MKEKKNIKVQVEKGPLFKYTIRQTLKDFGRSKTNEFKEKTKAKKDE